MMMCCTPDCVLMALRCVCTGCDDDDDDQQFSNMCASVENDNNRFSWPSALPGPGQGHRLDSTANTTPKKRQGLIKGATMKTLCDPFFSASVT